MTRNHRIPQVAIFIETSMAFGRGLIEGVTVLLHRGAQPDQLLIQQMVQAIGRGEQLL
jgi:hypothetical protein